MAWDGDILQSPAKAIQLKTSLFLSPNSVSTTLEKGIVPRNTRQNVVLFAGCSGPMSSIGEQTKKTYYNNSTIWA